MAVSSIPTHQQNIKVRPIRIVGDVAYVPLTRGLEAVIDASDVPLVDQFNWYAAIVRNGQAYAARNIGAKTAMMHRLILGAREKENVDHVNGDGLDNRRANLRTCTHAENMRNRVVDRRNRLGMKGVYAEGGGYRASIKTDGRTIHLGRYRTPEEAAAAYAGAAKALFGEFAST